MENGEWRMEGGGKVCVFGIDIEVSKRPFSMR